MQGPPESADELVEFIGRLNPYLLSDPAYARDLVDYACIMYIQDDDTHETDGSQAAKNLTPVEPHLLARVHEMIATGATSQCVTAAEADRQYHIDELTMRYALYEEAHHYPGLEAFLTSHAATGFHLELADFVLDVWAFACGHQELAHDMIRHAVKNYQILMHVPPAPFMPFAEKHPPTTLLEVIARFKQWLNQWKP